MAHNNTALDALSIKPEPPKPLVDCFDYWRLCDELNVIQAALLIVEKDPALLQDYVLGWEPYDRPVGFDAAFAALRNAVQAERLPANIRRETRICNFLDFPREGETIGVEDGKHVFYQVEPNWERTTIAVDDLRNWLRKRGIKTGFFFPLESAQKGFLDPSDKHYSPKLAAAIAAWEAVSRDSSLKRGKTVKQALLVWLRRHADQYGLTKEDGSPNEQGIEEISKIANWDTKGGAPKTPGE